MTILDQFVYCYLPGTFLFLAVVALLLWLWQRKTGLYSKMASPPPPASPGSPAPTPPAPVPAVSKSYGWVWLVVGILAGVIAYYTVLPALRTSAPAPQATAPKKKEYGPPAERALKVTFQNNTHFILKAENVPWTENARYLVVFRLIQARQGKLFIEINGGKGGDGPFDFDSYIVGEEITVVFFENGFRGNPKYFVPGTNWIKLYSPEGGPITIRYAQIITYWE